MSFVRAKAIVPDVVKGVGVVMVLVIFEVVVLVVGVVVGVVVVMVAGVVVVLLVGVTFFFFWFSVFLVMRWF